MIHGEKAVKKKQKNLFNPVLKGLRLKIEPAESPSNTSGENRPKTLGNENNTYDEDMAYFLEAMADVTPLMSGEKKVVPSRGTNIRPAHPPPDDESVVMNHLRDLIRGAIEMDITFSDEYMEGAVDGVSRKIIKRLKNGRIPVQDYIDLHGLTRQMAEDAVRDFLMASHKRGYRCVLIVHGRGLNSPAHLPVLKEMLPKWLSQGSVRKIVLAFATSRPYDGGTGATYVLLRRR